MRPTTPVTPTMLAGLFKLQEQDTSFFSALFLDKQDVAIAGKKPGGSNIGHLVAKKEDKVLVKIGTPLSLLAKAYQKMVANDEKKAKLFLGFIIGDVELVTKLSTITSKSKDEVVHKLLDQLKKYQAENPTLAVDAVDDVYAMACYLIENVDDEEYKAIFRNIIGFASFAHLINTACGQRFNNQLQKLSLPETSLDDIHLWLTKGNQLLLASRMNQAATPFDHFLLSVFPEEKFEDDAAFQVWLAQCKKTLLEKFDAIHGLGGAIFIRLLMGESADLGPDNMLLVADQDKKLQVVNIDVTGMRYERKEMFVDPKTGAQRFGWMDILRSEDEEILANRLFDASVFSMRFLEDVSFLTKERKSLVGKVIIDVLREKISPECMQQEVAAVCERLKKFNPDQIKTSFSALVNQVWKQLPETLRPDEALLSALVSRSAAFISKAVDEAQKTKEGRFELEQPAPALTM